jgi:hypothetical protein
VRAIAAITQATAIPTNAPVDSPVDFLDVADPFVTDPFENAAVGAVLVVDDLEGL